MKLCSQCNISLKSYYLKEGICYGCRFPHLVVTAVTDSPILTVQDCEESNIMNATDIKYNYLSRNPEVLR